MNTTQKLIKLFAILLAGLIIINIFSIVLELVFVFIPSNNTTGKDYYEVYQNVNSVEIDSSFSDILILEGNEFSVKGSDIKNEFTSKIENGVLKIEEKTKKLFNNKKGGNVTITIPVKILEKLEIEHGAGMLTIKDIDANYFELEHGAGKLLMNNVTFHNTNIDGGAGEIVITSSKLNNMDLDLGAGHLDLEAYINGNSDIDCGIGKVDITLLGNKSDYQIRVNKGLGKITIDNSNYKDESTFGNGYNKLNIDGGIGNINVTFMENL